MQLISSSISITQVRIELVDLGVQLSVNNGAVSFFKKVKE